MEYDAVCTDKQINTIFNYLHHQTTLPATPNDVTVREAGIYCVSEMNCVPYRVLC